MESRGFCPDFRVRSFRSSLLLIFSLPLLHLLLEQILLHLRLILKALVPSLHEDIMNGSRIAPGLLHGVPLVLLLLTALTPMSQAVAAPGQNRAAVHMHADGSGLQEVVVTLRPPSQLSPVFFGPWTDALEQTRVKVRARIGVSAGAELTHFVAVPMMHLRVTPAQRLRLAQDPDVLALGGVRTSRPFLDESVPLIEADVAHASPGVQGFGQTVAVLDTGVDYTHAELGGCFGGGCKVIAGYDFADNDSDPMDCDQGTRHGSNVAAIAAGTRGVAPEANIAALKVFGGAECNEASNVDIAEAIDWAVRFKDTYHIVSINLSLGFAGEPYRQVCDKEVPDGFTSAVQTATDAGILVVAAAGNDGFADDVSYPACLEDAMAVANSYDERVLGLSWPGICTDPLVKPDDLACSSNGGILIDLAAPGAIIEAADAGPSGSGLGGTSQAAPHVAGAALLLAQANSTLSSSEIWEALVTSSDVVLDTRSTTQVGGYSYPRLNALDALDAIPLQTDPDQDGFSFETDCDNQDPKINPDATELCNDRDDDCNGSVDDTTDADSDQFYACVDCREDDPAIHPGALEADDNIDNDCDGVTDEGFSSGCGCSSASDDDFTQALLLLVPLTLLRARSRRRSQTS